MPQKIVAHVLYVIENQNLSSIPLKIRIYALCHRLYFFDVLYAFFDGIEHTKNAINGIEHIEMQKIAQST
jgi:hypothetical protein